MVVGVGGAGSLQPPRPHSLCPPGCRPLGWAVQRLASRSPAPSLDGAPCLHRCSSTERTWTLLRPATCRRCRSGTCWKTAAARWSTPHSESAGAGAAAVQRWLVWRHLAQGWAQQHLAQGWAQRAQAGWGARTLAACRPRPSCLPASPHLPPRTCHPPPPTPHPPPAAPPSSTACTPWTCTSPPTTAPTAPPSPLLACAASSASGGARRWRRSTNPSPCRRCVPVCAGCCWRAVDALRRWRGMQRQGWGGSAAA